MASEVDYYEPDRTSQPPQPVELRDITTQALDKLRPLFEISSPSQTPTAAAKDEAGSAAFPVVSPDKDLLEELLAKLEKLQATKSEYSTEELHNWINTKPVWYEPEMSAEDVGKWDAAHKNPETTDRVPKPPGFADREQQQVDLLKNIEKLLGSQSQSSSAGQQTGKSEDLGSVLTAAIEKLGDTLAEKLVPAETKPEEPKPEPKKPSLQERFHRGLDRANEIMTSPDERTGASVAKGIGSTAMALGGPAGMVASVFMKTAESGFKVVENLRRWNDVLRQSDRSLAQFSASMAQVMAESDMRDMERQRKKGEARAESARYREEGRAQLEDAWAPISNTIADVKNMVVGGLNRVVAAILRPVGGLLGGAAAPTPITLSEWASDIARSWTTRYGLSERATPGFRVPAWD